MSGSGRGEELARSLGDVVASHPESPAVVAYSLVVLAAVGATLGKELGPKVLMKVETHKVVCSTLVFQSAHWPSALYGLKALLNPCGDIDKRIDLLSP